MQNRLALLLGTAAMLALSGAAAADIGDLVKQVTCAVGVCEGWQYDGGQEDDAGDDCEHAGPALAVDETAEGLVLPVVDEADFYLVPIPVDAVNATIRIELTESGGAGNLLFAGFTPACARTFEDLANEVIPRGHDGSNPGRGHTLCRGDGHIECLVRDVVVGDDFVSFRPQQAVAFVMSVTLDPNAVATPGTPNPPPLPETGPEPATCHQQCFAPVNGAFGYSLTLHKEFAT